MRDWTVRWVSVVVVIWVYSSSLALSSTSLWLAARYLSLNSNSMMSSTSSSSSGSSNSHTYSTTTTTTNTNKKTAAKPPPSRPSYNYHRQYHTTTTTITSVAAIQSRGGADEYDDDYENNNNIHQNDMHNNQNNRKDDATDDVSSTSISNSNNHLLEQQQQPSVVLRTEPIEIDNDENDIIGPTITNSDLTLSSSSSPQQQPNNIFIPEQFFGAAVAASILSWTRGRESHHLQQPQEQQSKQLQQQEHNDDHYHDKRVSHHDDDSQDETPSSSSSSSLILAGISKHRWSDRLAQRFQQYRKQRQSANLIARGGGSDKSFSLPRIQRRRRHHQHPQHQRKNKTLKELQISFLDRIALVSTAFWNRETEAVLENTTATTTTNNNTNATDATAISSSQTTGTSRSSSSNSNSILWSLRRRLANLNRNLTTTTSVTDQQQLNDITTNMEDDDDWITAQSDLTLPGRHITIVTTAALPWMTGTAVNPLLRAAHLCRRTNLINNNNNSSLATNNDTTTKTQWVTLVIPWLELTEDQQEVYQRVFTSPQEQEEYIRNWLRNDAGLADVADANQGGLKIIFYPARYHLGMRSVFAMGDICSLIPNDEADVCILEEPEHCNWFRAPGDGWTRKFHYVVGVVHTNYKEYASAQYHGLWTAPALAVISSAMVRAYCHKVIKLSDVLQTFAPEKEVTSNVHGVRADFLEEGFRRSQLALEQRAQHKQGIATTLPEAHSGDHHHRIQAGKDNSNKNGVYFIGKLLWAKGLDLLLELQEYYKQCTGEYFPIDIYGSGPDERDIKRAYMGRQKQQKQQQPKQEQRTPVTRRRRTFRLWNRGGRRANRNLIAAGSSSSSSSSFSPEGEVAASETTETAITATATPISSSLHLLGTTMSLEGGTVASASQGSESEEVPSGNVTLVISEADVDDTDIFSESLGDSVEVDTWFASFSSLSTSLKELLKSRAKERLLKLKETIKSTTESIEIPRTLHELRRSRIPANFPGRVDHSSLKDSCKIFVNPSISEVLCTTTAEALAMGKFAIIPVHPSNAFFYQFPNCLAYRNKFEFVANLRWALTHDPEPLTPDLAREFTWEAATDRLIHASAITWKEAREREKLGLSKLDERIAWLHNELGKGAKGDFFRQVMGAGPASHQVKYQAIMKYHQQQGQGQEQQQQQQQLLLLSKAELENLHRFIASDGVDDDDDDDNYDDDYDSDNDDEGLTRKFRKSSFVRAIRKTIANGLPSWNSLP